MPGAPTPPTGAAQPRSSGRRADAERSIAKILEAAVQLLNERPDAAMDDIAKAAGVSRQTVYAHFPSREILVAAVTDQATGEALDAMDQADLEHGAPAEAMVRLLDATWAMLEHYPLLLRMPSPTTDQTAHDRHQPVLGRLRTLIERGQLGGDFDRTVPADWLVAATIALGDAVGEEVRAGRVSTARAPLLLRRSVLAVLGAGTVD